MIITSDAFIHNSMMPSKFTLDGANISPPLRIEKIPPESKSLVLIAENPDTPIGNFIHWVMYNISIRTKIIDENIPNAFRLLDGSKNGINDFGKIGYEGPRLTSGLHRYFFKIYALNKKLLLDGGASSRQTLKNMDGHILDKADLIGLYKHDS